MTFRIHPAETPEDIAAARGLFRAYVDSLAIDLGFCLLYTSDAADEVRRV